MAGKWCYLVGFSDELKQVDSICYVVINLLIQHQKGPRRIHVQRFVYVVSETCKDTWASRGAIQSGKA